MINLQLNKTPEQAAEERNIAEQEFNKEREQARKKRTADLLEIKRKNKRKTIIVYTITIITLLSLLIFGIYNTFIVHRLNENDVDNIIYNQPNNFDSSGVRDYIRNSLPEWLKATARFGGSSNIKEVTPKLDSLAIERIRPIDRNTAEVFFTVDLTSVSVDANDSKITHDITNRYRFFIPIELVNAKDSNGNTVPNAYGYRPIADLSIRSISPLNTDKKEEEGKVTNDNYAFNEDTKMTPEETEPIKVKITNILSDLYAGKDVSQDYTSYYKFEPNGSTLKGVSDFAIYKQPNKLGYNGIIKYTIETQEGLTFENTSYIAVKQNGTTWKLVGLL